MKIYTGTGDKGKTSLFSGERVEKCHRRIEAYGDVDELNSFLGALAAALPVGGVSSAADLRRIQSYLFHIGARLATDDASASAKELRKVREADAVFLETAIDHLQAALPALQGFILPSGSPAAGWAHIARAVCRRAERRVVELTLAGGDEPLQGAIVFLNRLSDYLFVLARYCNHLQGIPDEPWRP